MADAKIKIGAQDDTASAFKTARANIDSFAESVSAMAGAVAAALGTAAALTQSIRAAADYGDSIAKLAVRSGVTTEAISALGYAADMSDVSTSELAKGLRVLAKDASTGGDNLRALGIELKDASGQAKSADVLFAEVADRFAGLPDSVAKTNLAIELFGDKVGPQLLPLLNSGAAGLKDMADEAKRFGLVVDQDASKASELFNDNITRLQSMSKGAAVTLGNALIPAINDLVNEFLTGTKYGNGLIDTIVMLGTINPFKTQAANIKELGAELQTLEAQRERRAKNPLYNNDALDAEIKSAKGKLGYLKDLQRQAALDGSGDNESGAESRRLGLASPAFVIPSLKPASAPKSAGDGKEPKDAIDDTARALAHYVKGLDTAQQKTEGLTELQKAQAFLRSQGAAGEIDQVQELVLGMAQQIDQQKALADARLQNGKYIDGLVAEQAAMTDANTVLAEHLQEIGLSKEALDALTLSRLDQAIAVQQSVVDMVALNGESSAELSLLERKLSLMQEQRDLTAKGQVAQGAADTAAEQDKASKDFASTLHNDVKGALSAAFRDNNDPISAFGDALGNVIFTRVTNSLADAMLNSMFGSSAGSSAGFSLASLFSFDGGGYTGGGARTGGVDGKGGFMAVLHPQESVIDHTKGQSASGASATTLVVNVIESPGNGGQQSRRSENGVDMLDIFVDRVKSSLASDIARGNGSVPNALSSTYGLNRVAGAY